MPIGFQIWLTLAGLVGLVWILRAVAVELALRRRYVLSPDRRDSPPDPAPRVSIVLAARNEQDNIEQCVDSLLNQDYPDFELIVVDDRSTDRTPAILDRLAKAAPDRLRVLRVQTLPEGWFGKHHAVHLGVAMTDGEWLFFTDSDCRLTSPRSLSIAVRDAHENRADFLSAIPTLEPRTIWDRIVQSVCTVVLVSWFRPASVNDPDSKTAYANGAFMLIRRDCYDALGGHHAVRNCINDDVQLARLAKMHGRRLRVVESRNLVLTRMYDDLPSLFRGWSRIFFGCFIRPRAVVAALTMISLSVVFPWISLVLAAIGCLSASTDTQPAWNAAFWTWSAVVGLAQIVTLRLFLAVGYGAAWSVTYILGAFVTVAILLNALVKSLGITRTTWRATTYAPTLGDALRESEPPAGLTPATPTLASSPDLSPLQPKAS